MKLYIAGKFEERKRISGLMREAEGLGHEITFDWTTKARNFDVATATSDLRGVKEADVVIVVADKDYEYKGIYCEMGAALAAGKPVYIVGDYADRCIFSLLCTKAESLKEVICK